MVYGRIRVKAVFVSVVAVPVYGDAGDPQAVHDHLVRGGEASANGFLLYKPAVGRVDIRRCNVVGVVFILVRNVIVFNVFRKISVYFLCEINVSCNVSVVLLFLLVNVGYDLVDYFLEFTDRLV